MHVHMHVAIAFEFLGIEFDSKFKTSTSTSTAHAKLINYKTSCGRYPVPVTCMYMSRAHAPYRCCSAHAASHMRMRMHAYCMPSSQIVSLLH